MYGKPLAAILLCLPVSLLAAGIQYVDGDDTQQQYLWYGHTGIAESRYEQLNGPGGFDWTRYDDSETLPYGPTGTDAFSVSTSGTWSKYSENDSWGYANADFSALSETGFSLSASLGSASATGYRDQLSAIRRILEIQIEETTTFYLSAEWSNLVDTGSGYGAMTIAIVDNLQCSGYGNCENAQSAGMLTAGLNVNVPESGAEYTQITLGPGEYTIIASLKSTENGSSPHINSFDANLSISTVPVPAAVWLFGSALAGLGFVRRRINTP